MEIENASDERKETLFGISKFRGKSGFVVNVDRYVTQFIVLMWKSILILQMRPLPVIKISLLLIQDEKYDGRKIIHSYFSC